MRKRRTAALPSGEREPRELGGGPRELVRQVVGAGDPADPYALLARVREAGPVWMSDDVVVFSSYEDCAAVLRDPAAVGDEPREPGGGADDAAAVRLRELLARALAPARGDALVAELRTLTDDLFDAVASRGRLEAVTDLSYRLPMTVLCRLLGVPSADAQWLHRQCMSLSPALDPHALLLPDAPSHVAERDEARRELDAYFGELAAEWRDRPGTGQQFRAAGGQDRTGSGLLARLADAGPGEAPLPTASVARACRTLLAAGHEPTAGLISQTLLTLVHAPHELDAVRRTPSYAGQVVEEVLRTEPPFQWVRRRAAADLDVHGTRVPHGTRILLLLAAAQRDPRLQPSPDVFAPAGHGVAHLAFGLGAQVCPGSPLARAMASTVAIRFAQRVTGARLAPGRPTFRANVALRGLRALWIDADDFGSRALPWPPPPSPALSTPSHGRTP